MKIAERRAIHHLNTRFYTKESAIAHFLANPTWYTWEGELETLVDEHFLPIVFSCTKLEIRRALRSIGQEDKLDALLESSALFKREWADTVIVDFSDPIARQGILAIDVDVEALIKIIKYEVL